jgi:hypothetical protein
VIMGHDFRCQHVNVWSKLTSFVSATMMESGAGRPFARKDSSKACARW